MGAGILQPQFGSEDAAREFLEAKRWPDGIQGGVSVFVTGRTHVILDIKGHFAP
jgi:hypothetical protein